MKSRSLICLSTNSFKTLFLATIDDKTDANTLAQGTMYFQYEDMSVDEMLLNALPGIKYTAIESSVYFEVRLNQNLFAQLHTYCE